MLQKSLPAYIFGLTYDSTAIEAGSSVDEKLQGARTGSRAPSIFSVLPKLLYQGEGGAGIYACDAALQIPASAAEVKLCGPLFMKTLYRNSSMISSSAWREGRVNSCGILARGVSVRLSCSTKLGAVVFT